MLKRSGNPDLLHRKIILLLLVVLFISTLAFADYRITRGPDIGEIYFVGPTATGEGIYYSTDFGESAVCMDSTVDAMSICADKTEGVLYYFAMPENLYYSDNYGNQGSWQFRNSGIYIDIISGVTEGHIYNSIASHSQDYGINFIPNSYQGFFGNLSTAEIDNENDVGYAIVNQNYVLDSLYLLISYDSFDSLLIQQVFNFGRSSFVNLSRGNDNGEIYLYRSHLLQGKELWYSNDYGETWEQKDTFNCPNLPIKGIVGGRQPGELYMVVEYVQLMYEIAHIYIYHSVDYGETFTVYHPFSHGPEPYVANFEGNPTIGTAPLTVQFIDLSTGENLQYWEWDFDNDGTVDSYEQNPEYTYQDTGYYSVSLTIHQLQLDTSTRLNYIHVTNGSDCDEEIIKPIEIKLTNYPNPFNQETTILYKLHNNIRNTELAIYNIKGELVKKIKMQNAKGKIEWNGTDDKDNYLSNGIYLYKLDVNNSPIRKMILLK